MYTERDLDYAKKNVIEVRLKNKGEIKSLEERIDYGYNKHGIIFTSSARSYQGRIEKLKAEIKEATKERNLIKKNLNK